MLLTSVVEADPDQPGSEIIFLSEAGSGIISGPQTYCKMIMCPFLEITFHNELIVSVLNCHIFLSTYLVIK